MNYARKNFLSLGCTCTHCTPWLRLCWGLHSSTTWPALRLTVYFSTFSTKCFWPQAAWSWRP